MMKPFNTILYDWGPGAVEHLGFGFCVGSPGQKVSWVQARNARRLLAHRSVPSCIARIVRAVYIRIETGGVEAAMKTLLMRGGGGLGFRV